MASFVARRGRVITTIDLSPAPAELSLTQTGWKWRGGKRTKVIMFGTVRRARSIGAHAGWFDLS